MSAEAAALALGRHFILEDRKVQLPEGYCDGSRASSVLVPRLFWLFFFFFFILSGLYCPSFQSRVNHMTLSILPPDTAFGKNPTVRGGNARVTSPFTPPSWSHTKRREESRAACCGAGTRGEKTVVYAISGCGERLTLKIVTCTDGKGRFMFAI